MRLHYYRQTSNIKRTLVGNNIIDDSDLVGAHHLLSLLKLHLHSRLNIWLQWIGERHLGDETRNILVLGFDAPNIKDVAVEIATTHPTLTKKQRLRTRIAYIVIVMPSDELTITQAASISTALVLTKFCKNNLAPPDTDINFMTPTYRAWV